MKGKRLRARLQRSNLMVKDCAKRGADQGEYTGRPPKYVNLYKFNPEMPAFYVKIEMGVPFVRKDREGLL